DELGQLDAHAGWNAARWRDALDGYFAEYDRIGTGADARNPALLHITRQEDGWQVRQVFDDPGGDHDWAISAEVALTASDEAREPVICATDVGPLSDRRRGPLGPTPSPPAGHQRCRDPSYCTSRGENPMRNVRVVGGGAGGRRTLKR